MPTVPDFLLNRVDPRFLQTGGIDPRSVFAIPNPGQLFSAANPPPQPQGLFQGGPTASPAGSVSNDDVNDPASTASQPATAANIGNALSNASLALGLAGVPGMVIGRLAGRAIAAMEPSGLSISNGMAGINPNTDVGGMSLGQAMSQASTLSPAQAQNVASSLGLGIDSSGTAAQAAAAAANEATGLGLGVDSSGGGGGGGGTKVICTLLMQNGYIERNLYNFAHRGYHVPRHVKRGYLLWAEPLVRLARRHRWLIPVLAPFGRAWSAHVAHLRHPGLYPPCRRGAMLYGLGWGLCALIGRLTPEAVHGAV